jgi:hypothetical protein
VTANLAMLKKLLTRPIAYHRIFAQIGGGATAGLMLSQAWYWTPRVDEQGWFYKSIAEWEEETGLTRTEQETARERLIKRELLEVKRAGMPARLYFRVNVEKLASLIAENPHTSLQETRKQEEAEPAYLIAENLQTTIEDAETTTKTTPKTTTRKKAVAHAPPQQPKQFDSRIKHPAIEAVRSFIHCLPDEQNRDEIIEALGSNPDKPKLSECYRVWKKQGFNKVSIVPATEWYVYGIPEKYLVNGARGQPARPSRVDASMTAVRERIAELEEKKRAEA